MWREHYDGMDSSRNAVRLAEADRNENVVKVTSFPRLVHTNDDICAVPELKYPFRGEIINKTVFILNICV